MSNFQPPIDLSKRAPSTEIELAAWLVSADENTLREYVKISESVPVLMLITQRDDAVSAQLRALVLKALEAAQGRFAGLEIDISSSPALAQAVGVQQAPALIAILAGQPAPLFQGLVQPEQLATVLGQVLQLATQNQIVGKAKVSEKAQVTKPLSPEHQMAFDAIDRGDFAAAKIQYEKILVNAPADQDAKAGLAQVNFLIRLQTQPGASELDKKLFAADQLFASGDAEAAFDSLLGDFAQWPEHRDAIRARLLELFLVLGDSEKIVLDARRKLASLMF